MIPKRGEFGEPWKIVTGPGTQVMDQNDKWVFLENEQRRIVESVNACSGCDPDKLGELIRAARAMEQVVLHTIECGECESALIVLSEALDAFTERTE